MVFIANIRFLNLEELSLPLSRRKSCVLSNKAEYRQTYAAKLARLYENEMKRKIAGIKSLLQFFLEGTFFIAMVLNLSSVRRAMPCADILNPFRVLKAGKPVG
jgi:hypothetical protein